MFKIVFAWTSSFIATAMIWLLVIDSGFSIEVIGPLPIAYALILLAAILCSWGSFVMLWRGHFPGLRWWQGALCYVVAEAVVMMGVILNTAPQHIHQMENSASFFFMTLVGFFLIGGIPTGNVLALIWIEFRNRNQRQRAKRRLRTHLA